MFVGSSGAVTRVHGLLAVALLVVSGCSAADPPARETQESDSFGLTEADYEAGARTEQAAVRECMESAGWPYIESDPDDLIVVPNEVGPAWGIAADFLRAIDGDSGSGSQQQIPDTVREADSGAWLDQVILCAEDAGGRSEARRQAASSAETRLEQAWEEFRQGAPFQDAAEEWSRCMEGLGFFVDDPERVSDEIGNRLVAILEGAVREDGAYDPGLMDRDEIVELQRDEVALFDANVVCRATTLEPVETEFKATLLKNEIDAVEAIRRAVRGE